MLTQHLAYYIYSTLQSEIWCAIEVGSLVVGFSIKSISVLSVSEIFLKADFPEPVLSIEILCFRKHQILKHMYVSSGGHVLEGSYFTLQSVLYALQMNPPTHIKSHIHFDPKSRCAPGRGNIISDIGVFTYVQ